MLHISGLPVVRPWMTFLKSLYLQNYAPDLCAVFTELVVGLFNKSYLQPDLGHLGSHPGRCRVKSVKTYEKSPFALARSSPKRCVLLVVIMFPVGINCFQEYTRPLTVTIAMLGSLRFSWCFLFALISNLQSILHQQRAK